jgi:hypothetical protein
MEFYHSLLFALTEFGREQGLNKRRNRRFGASIKSSSPWRHSGQPYIMSHDLLTGSSFQERRRRSVPVGYLPEVFSPSEEYAICILPVLAWEYIIVEWMVHYCFMFKKQEKRVELYAYNVFRILLIETKIFNNYKRIIPKRSNN